MPQSSSNQTIRSGPTPYRLKNLSTVSSIHLSVLLCGRCHDFGPRFLPITDSKPNSLTLRLSFQKPCLVMPKMRAPASTDRCPWFTSTTTLFLVSTRFLMVFSLIDVSFLGRQYYLLFKGFSFSNNLSGM